MQKLSFIEKQSFPLASTWLDSLYQNYQELASIVANLAGSNCIVAGIEPQAENYYSDGFFVLNGKLLPFRRSQQQKYIIAKSEIIQVEAEGETYTPAVNQWCEFSSTNTGADDYLLINNWVKMQRLNLFNPQTAFVGEKVFDGFPLGGSATSASALYVISNNNCTIHFKLLGVKARISTERNVRIVYSGELFPFHPAIYSDYKMISTHLTESGKLARLQLIFQNGVDVILPSNWDTVNGEDIYASVSYNYNAV